MQQAKKTPSIGVKFGTAAAGYGRKPGKYLANPKEGCGNASQDVNAVQVQIWLGKEPKNVCERLKTPGEVREKKPCEDKFHEDRSS